METLERQSAYPKAVTARWLHMKAASFEYRTHQAGFQGTAVDNPKQWLCHPLWSASHYRSDRDDDASSQLFYLLLSMLVRFLRSQCRSA